MAAVTAKSVDGHSRDRAVTSHWRKHNSASIRTFCQVEAVETIIWLTDVAPQPGKAGEQILSSFPYLLDRLDDYEYHSEAGFNARATTRRDAR